MICLRRSFLVKRVRLYARPLVRSHYLQLQKPEFSPVYSSTVLLPDFPAPFLLETTSHLVNRSKCDPVEYHGAIHCLGSDLLLRIQPSTQPTQSKSDVSINKLAAVEPDDPNEKQKKSDGGGKLTLWQKTKKELLHYYHGFRLLGLEVKIVLGILLRVLRGHTLTRREKKQCIRTVADIARLVPFAVFIIVPFMEFLLPFYLKFFPFMLPSTFKDKSTPTDKIQQRLRAKLELTRFLQETLNQTTGVSAASDGTPTIAEFQNFLKKVQESGLPPTNEELVRFSKYFEDQITLDSLEAKQLKMLCQLLSVPTIGPRALLKWQLQMRVRWLKSDDQLLAKEGVDHIPSWELQTLCQDRGMRSVGLTEERLRSQLRQWLSLHLEQNVPITLLLFSRALHVYKLSSEELSLKDAIAQLPRSASEEVTARVLESLPSSAVDPLTRMEVLRKEQAGIKADRQQRKVELEQEQAAAKAAKVEPSVEALKDSAPTLKGLPHEELEGAPEPLSTTKPTITKTADPSAACPSCAVPETKPTETVDEEVTEISSEDLTQIQAAIATSSTAYQEETIDDLKEEIAETAKMRKQQEASLISVGSTDKRTSKAAARLAANVNRMISEMDKMIEKLNDERKELLKGIELREVHAKHSSEQGKKDEMLHAIEADHQRVIDINDLMLALRRIQKVPDDTRWQKILDVLDEDRDGKIELQHVLSVIKLLGQENVKLSTKDVTRVLEMVDNEEFLETLSLKKTASSGSPVNQSTTALNNPDESSPSESEKHSRTNEQPKGPPQT